MKVSFFTLGCRVNQYESDAMAEILSREGFEIVPFGEDCDISVINTCTVTAESDRKSRQHIRRAKAKAKKVVVCGCFSQVSPNAAVDCGADAVLGNGEKDKISEIVKMLVNDIDVGNRAGDIMSYPYDTLSVSMPKRVRTFIKIEDGCENRCAYCIIPKARGKVRSKTPEKVLEEVRVIASAGCGEIILTGIETASYGRDLKSFGLPSLIEKVSEIDGVTRIALGSLDPSAMNSEFADRVSKIPQVLPHFHLSVQAGCTKTLNRMRRKYTAEKILENMEYMRSVFPGVTYSADVIVGFPGESLEDFEETVEFCKKARFLHLHIFPYSIREGTEAAVMYNQIDDKEKRRRSAFLAGVQREVEDSLLDSYVKAHSTPENPVYVLCEKWEGGITNGHSEHFAECNIKTDRDTTGEILPVVLEDREGSVLWGKSI